MFLFSVHQKVADRALRPWQQGFPQTASQMSLVLSIVNPVVTLIKAVLGHLIESRGKDVSVHECHTSREIGLCY